MLAIPHSGHSMTQLHVKLQVPAFFFPLSDVQHNMNRKTEKPLMFLFQLITHTQTLWGEQQRTLVKTQTTVCTFPKANMPTPASSPLLMGPVAGPSALGQGFPLSLQRGTVKSNCFCWLWARVTITLNLASARQPWNFSAHEAAVATGHVQK